MANLTATFTCVCNDEIEYATVLQRVRDRSQEQNPLFSNIVELGSFTFKFDYHTTTTE